MQAAALIRNRKLSPVEYLDAVLKAAERANPVINCFREVMVDRARHDAKKAEEAVTRGEKLGPLHGIPISVKDLVDVEGAPTRHGSAIFEGNSPAAADDLLVQRLRAAGAVIFAKATTPEFGVKGLTDGPFGVTRNPWNLQRT
ncbi:amidase family protein, partial [Reyranella sp.]|uniref:amidase family protein n=1 Tax=Reyranella sp. TaxID=1929291 RepID=UPI003F6F107D